MCSVITSKVIGKNLKSGKKTTTSPYRVNPGLTISSLTFSVVRQARGVAQRPGCKKSSLTLTNRNETWHDTHKCIPDAKFESGSSSSFRHDITKREEVIRFRYLPPENGFNFHEMSFYVQKRPKIDPMSISAIFKQRKVFLIFKISGRLNEKSNGNLPDCPNLVRKCLKNRN